MNYLINLIFVLQLSTIISTVVEKVTLDKVATVTAVNNTTITRAEASANGSGSDSGNIGNSDAADGNTAATVNHNHKELGVMPVAEKLVHVRKKPSVKSIKPVVRPKRAKYKNHNKRSKIKLSFAEPPASYCIHKPDKEIASYDASSIFDDLQHLNVESADFDLPPSSYDTQSTDLDFYSNFDDTLTTYTAADESDIGHGKEPEKLITYTYTAPEIRYSEPIHKPVLGDEAAAHVTITQPIHTTTYLVTSGKENIRKPHTTYGVPSELNYNSAYEKPSVNTFTYQTHHIASQPIQTGLSSYINKPTQSYQTVYANGQTTTAKKSLPHTNNAPANVFTSNQYQSHQHPYTPLHNTHNTNNHRQQQQQHQQHQHFVTSPANHEQNVEITYSPSYEINIPPVSNYEQHSYSYNKNTPNNGHSSDQTYDVIPSSNSQHIPGENTFNSHSFTYKVQSPTNTHANLHPLRSGGGGGGGGGGSSYPTSSISGFEHSSAHLAPPPNYEQLPSYQQSSYSHVPENFVQHQIVPNAPSDDYIPPFNQLPINYNYKQPTYDYPKTSYEVPIYDPVPFDDSRQHNDEIYPPNTNNHLNHLNAKSNNLYESKVTGSHLSASNSLLTETAPSDTVAVRTRRLRKRKQGNTNPSVAATKHILDVPELKKAFDNEKRLRTQDVSANINANQTIKALNPKLRLWGPVRVRSSLVGGSTTPTPIITNNRKRNVFHRTRNTTTTESPAKSSSSTSQKKEAITAGKGSRRNVYRKIVSHSKHGLNASTQRLPPTTAEHNKSKFIKHHTKGGLDTTPFKTPYNDVNLQQNLPKNHKLF